MKKNVGMRETLAMKAQARLVLERLIPLFEVTARGKHFKGSHQSQEGAQIEKGLEGLKAGIHRTPLGTSVVGNQALYDAVNEGLRTLTSAGYRILECIAKDTPVRDADLDRLTDALETRKGVIRFHSDPNRDAYCYQIQPLNFVFASNLLTYMNLCAQYGREHDVCQQCGALMIAGRGGKKFCSAECRKAYWSYDRQKAYYAKKRKGGKKK